jgi:3'-5' exoribonuclease
VAAPAARSVHHAYRHGLLEHTVLVAQAVAAVCVVFPEIDRDVAVTGALLHDIGKLDAYTTDPLAIDLTDVGKLYGEIPLGFTKLRGLIASIEGFDPDRARAVLHVIISHHGSLEHGSPAVPATREAVVVSAMDGLGARLGIYDRLEKALPAGERWTAFERTINGRAYFGERLP